MANSTKDIASDAYLFFYPVVENMKTCFFEIVWPHNENYHDGPNVFKHRTELMDWSFTAIVAPNNDTAYSQAWLDLEASPIILSLPDVPLTADKKKRYYSMQLIDGYTFNVSTISPRTTGSFEAGSFLIIGPNYTESIPPQFDSKHVVRTLSRFIFIIGRTQMFDEDDIPNVKAIQAGYTLTPLLQQKAQLPVFPFVDTEELFKHSPEAQVFFTYANFIMKYVSIQDFEKNLFTQFSQISVGPGLSFFGQGMSVEQYKAIQDGITDASDKIDEGSKPGTSYLGQERNGWRGFVDPPIFGKPDVMKGQYLARAVGARQGLYGNDPAEAFYCGCGIDNDKMPLDSKNKYTLTFKADDIPPVKEGGFWSITLYRLPEKLFAKNPINRYSIGDRTDLQYNSSGGLTVYIQKYQPTDPVQARNWLPSPDPNEGYDSGAFNLYGRLYWPTDEALAGPYFPPGVINVGN